MMKSCLMFLLLPLIISSAESFELTQQEKCDLLAESIKEFVNDLSSPNALYSVLHSYLAVNAQDIDEVVKSSGYDFVTSSIERRAFACKLTESKSRRDVSRILGVKEEEIEEMYEILMEPIQTTGSVDNLLDIANVASLLFEWAEVTGYPTMPFNDSFEEITYLVFTKIHKEMSKKHVNKVFITSPFPVKVPADTVLKYFKTAQTYSEFEKGVHLMPKQLERFRMAMKHNSKGVDNASKNIQATMDFLYALNISGVLNLK